MELADAAELVQDLYAPAPGDNFTLQKRQADGSVKGYRLRVQYLRTDEDHAVLIDAQKYAKQMGEHPQEYGDLYKEGQAIELLRRALRRTEESTRPDGTKHYPPLFVNAEQLRQSFTNAEMAQCLNMYEVVRAKYSCVEDFRPEAIDMWASRLSDTMVGPLFLSQLDSSQWPALLMSLASRVSELSEKTGQPLPNWQDFSEFNRENSDSGTGGSTSLPSAVSSDGNPLPSTRLVDSREAREWVRKKGDGAT